jgi:predicted GIY-YIG superfamily endonuclease
MNTDLKPWYFYLIQNDNFTYAGVSPDPTRRLRQHNCEIKGGAKYTTSKSCDWKHICLISGFRNKIEAMQFEWAIKHIPPRNSGGVINRIKKLYILLNYEKWTSKAPDATEVNLNIKWLFDVKNVISSDIYNNVPTYITQEFLN